MRAFLLACIATAVITVGADIVLRNIDASSETTFSSENVRLK